MKTLVDLLYRVSLVEFIGSNQVKVDALVIDSRLAKKGALFCAIKGTTANGHDYIEEVVKKGCFVVVCEHLPQNLNAKVTYIKVKDSSKAIGIIADNFYDNPSSKLELIGITGTNGKTTIATILHNLFTLLGYNCGLVSTVENKIIDRIIPATHTTPNAIALNHLLKEMVVSGCKYCFMEVSSHAAEQNRIEGLNFKVAIFSNITHDNLDYHLTFDNYRNAKKSFFDRLPSTATAIINADDKNGSYMVQNTNATVVYYSLLKSADHKAKIIENRLSGLHLYVDGYEIYCKLIGAFNAYNLLSVYAAAMALGENSDEVLQYLSASEPPTGRFDFTISPNNVTAIVDYAHTPDALDNVLQTISKITEGTNKKIITVVGCGGDRDQTKRPKMCSISAKYSNKVIITSDNPRFENPDKILDDMEQGLTIPQKKKVLRISDRKEAIKTAIALAQNGDIVLVAGKGHETYQDINGVKHDFNDKLIIQEIFKEN